MTAVAAREVGALKTALVCNVEPLLAQALESMFVEEVIIIDGHA